MEEMWAVYIVECFDGTLYCGITQSLHKRIRQHNEGKGAKYTRGRGPVTLRWNKLVCGKSAALKLEWKIKKMSRKKKLEWLKKGSK